MPIVRRPGLPSLAMLLVVLASTGSTRADATDPHIANRVLESQARLARGLMEQLAKGTPDANIVVSPASVAGMLTAADLGSDTRMHDVIRRTLQIAPGPTALAEMETLRAATIRATADADLSQATRLMFDRSEPPTPEALKRLNQSGVDTAVEDLRGPGAIADVDAWVARRTDGKITHALDRIERTDRMIALNTLLFEGRWSISFDKMETKGADFHQVSGKTNHIPFMRSDFFNLGKLNNDEQSAERAVDVPEVEEDDRFIGFQIPILGNHYVFVVVTSKDKARHLQEFGDHLAWLSGAAFQDHGAILIDMPLFRVRSHSNLMTALSQMGLSPTGPFPGFTQSSLELSGVDQNVDLNVDEQGIVVAAATAGHADVVGKLTLADETKILVDKPFAYAICDSKSGLIVVAGFMASFDE